jgi:hypothetical protein
MIASTASTSAGGAPSFSAIAREVAGLVDQVDQVLADHAADRIVDREQKLVGEMARQRRLGGDEGFEVVVAAVAAAGADSGPLRIGGRLLGVRPLGRRRRIVGKDVLKIGVEIALHRRAAGLQLVAEPVARLGGRLAAGAVRSRRLIGTRLVLAGALEQRIALELVLHVGGEVQIRQLQQLDRLHELRRHHERLALANQQLLGKGHRVRRTWSVSCLSASRRAVHPNLRTVVNPR